MSMQLKNEHDVYKDEDCMKKNCESLGQKAMEIINFEKEKMIPLKNK